MRENYRDLLTDRAPRRALLTEEEAARIARAVAAYEAGELTEPEGIPFPCWSEDREELGIASRQMVCNLRHGRKRGGR